MILLSRIISIYGWASAYVADDCELAQKNRDAHEQREKVEAEVDDQEQVVGAMAVRMYVGSMVVAEADQQEHRSAAHELEPEAVQQHSPAAADEQTLVPV